MGWIYYLFKDRQRMAILSGFGLGELLGLGGNSYLEIFLELLRKRSCLVTIKGRERAFKRGVSGSI